MFIEGFGGGQLDLWAEMRCDDEMVRSATLARSLQVSARGPQAGPRAMACERCLDSSSNVPFWLI